MRIHPRRRHRVLSGVNRWWWHLRRCGGKRIRSRFCVGSWNSGILWFCNPSLDASRHVEMNRIWRCFERNTLGSCRLDITFSIRPKLTTKPWVGGLQACLPRSVIEEESTPSNAAFPQECEWGRGCLGIGCNFLSDISLEVDLDVHLNHLVYLPKARAAQVSDKESKKHKIQTIWAFADKSGKSKEATSS